MASLFKWLFGLIIFLVLLLAAAAVILPMVVDPNDYKPQIVAAAKQKLGRDLAIEQDLSLTVFPWLGIETGGVRIGNAAGFAEQPFAEIDQLGLKVKLMPLLSQQIEVDTLVVKGLRLNLEKDASGKTNWDDLAGQQEEKPAQPGEAEKQPAEAPSPLALSVQGIQIEDARISWDDRQAGQKYVLDGVRVVTGALAPGATVPVEAGINFSSSKPAMTLKADLTASVSSDADLAVFRINDLLLNLDAAGEGLPTGGTKLTLKANVTADTKADTLNLDQLEISGPAMAASGELAVSAMQTNPAAKGTLRIAETNLKTLASMFASPIETTDPAALTRASGDLEFVYADGALKLDPLKVRLDDSNLTGYLHMLDSAGPVVRTRLDLDQIDLDRYMPPAVSASADGQAAAPAERAQSKPAQGQEDPFAALRTLDFVGEFKIGKLKVNNARMSNVTTRVVSSKGVLKVDPMAASLYEGSFEGSAVLDASGKQPKLSAKNQLTDIQVGPLLKDVAGEDRLIGRGELYADVRMVGLSEAEIRRSLNGTSRFVFKDGALKGVNIAQVIREGSSKLGLGGDKLDLGTPGQTDFTEISASLTMTNGVIKNDDLQAKSPLLRIAGKGEVDLPKDSIDYLITTELVKSLEGQGGKGRDDLAGIPIPVRVTGPLSKPSYRPDLEAALSAKARAQLEEKKQEVTKKMEEKAKEKLDGVFKGLFK
ncbi:MAG: AsmA family protein [Gammaproteobacteria bacterium]|nr:AsmA family protein [Gammaproteobacteria bacterium]